MMLQTEEQQESQTITVERPTGPKISLSEPRSLGELVVAGADSIARSAATSLTNLSVSTKKFYRRHRRAVVVSLSTLLGSMASFAAHVLLFSSPFGQALILSMSDTRVAVRPYVIGQTQTSFQVPTVTFQGLGDVVPGAAAYWGLSCYTAAYTGNVVDVVDTATGNTTGTRFKCDGSGNLVEVVSGSACTFVTGNACSPISSTCSGTCEVVTLYDQTGANSCTGGTNCDVTMAHATRPVFSKVGTVGCPSVSKPCFSTPGANKCLVSSNTFTQAQPFTYVITGHAADNSAFYAFIGGGTNFNTIRSANVADRLQAFAGSSLNLDGITVGNWHAIQGVMSTSGTLSADGSSASGSTGTQGFSAEMINIGGAGIPSTANCGASFNNFDGLLFEAAIYSGDKSASFATLNANQHSRGGF